MKCLKYIKDILIIAIISVSTATGILYFDKAFAQTTTTQQRQTVQVQQTSETKVTPLAVVNTPRTFLNKKIVMNAKFDKFSTLGLDYKPALKSSEEYISFLIKRDDTQFNIPLSEMKLFLKRKTAEKYIDLKTDDEIEIKGTVFSDALGDAWIDVNDITITKKAPDNEKKQ